MIDYKFKMVNPTILLVHGAWHNPRCFDLLIPCLEALSYTVVAPRNAVSFETNPTATYRDDVAIIHSVIKPLMAEGKEIFVVAHSYGGIPGCAATEGQSIRERSERGEKGGIVGILFMTAFCVPEGGASMNELSARGVNINRKMLEFKSPGIYCNALSRDYFYNDLSDEMAEKYLQRCGIHVLTAGTAQCHFGVNDLQVPSYYLACDMDVILPVTFQEEMSKFNPRMKLFRCGAGHSPFLSMPEKTADIITECVHYPQTKL